MDWRVVGWIAAGLRSHSSQHRTCARPRRRQACNTQNFIILKTFTEMNLQGDRACVSAPGRIDPSVSRMVQDQPSPKIIQREEEMFQIYQRCENARFAALSLDRSGTPVCTSMGLGTLDDL